MVLKFHGLVQKCLYEVVYVQKSGTFFFSKSCASVVSFPVRVN